MLDGRVALSIIVFVISLFLVSVLVVFAVLVLFVVFVIRRSLCLGGLFVFILRSPLALGARLVRIAKKLDDGLLISPLGDWAGERVFAALEN